MRALVMCTDDPVVVGLRQVADDHALTVMRPDEAERPAVLVIDLERPDAAALVREWRVRWPEALVAGHLAVPDRTKWVAAQRARL